MKVWHWILIGVTSFVALIGLIFGVVFYATSGATETTDQFFAAVRDGDYETANSLTAKRLQENQGPEVLKQFVTQTGLDDVVETSWSNRSINNDRGELVGTATTSTGAAIPLGVILIFEEDQWRISGFDVDAPTLSSGGSQAGTSRNLAPSDPLYNKAFSLARFNGKGLAEAMKRGDFEYFSEFWVDGTEPSVLAANFDRGELTDDQLDGLIASRPEMTSARLESDGALKVDMVFSTEGRKMRTVFTFVRDDPDSDDWKIVGLDTGNIPTS